MARRPESNFSNAIVNPQANLSSSRQEEDIWDPAAVDVADPLEGLSESERLSLAIRFGGIRMCAALTHGHSFESSIFRLPSKCLACQELVWGPFNRGCVCLVCKLTAHRSCTGSATMPKCPTKDLFANFCRLELGLRRPAPAAPSLDVQEAVLVAAPVRKMSSAASAHAEQDRVSSGDMEGWATVEETTANDSVERKTRRRESAFSWSPFGSSDRKRPLSFNANNDINERQQQKLELEAGEHAENIAVGGDKDATNAKNNPSVVSPHPDGVDGFSGHQPLTVEVRGADPATASAPANPKASVGIRDVGKMSVAGGVVGAVLGGPMGAVVGLKVGAVVGAGRWSVQGLWQRIEEDRQAAGAAAGLAVSSKSLDGDRSATGIEEGREEGVVEAGAQGSRDVWARIAYQVQEEEQRSSWELDPEQQALLEHGECDTGEVATFVVSKLLADDTTMPSRLYKALLDEFRSRHRLCICRRTVKRRSGIADMVALFPRVGGGRRTHRETIGSGDGGGGGEVSSVLQEDGTILSTSISGLEKSFSFVEETEIVEGEESDAASGDFMENGYGSGVEEIDAGEGERSELEPREEPVVSASTPRKPVEATARSSTAARRVAVSAIMSREASRNSSCRLDSWVRLEGGACANCGSRTADVSPHAQMTVGSSGRDVEDVRGDLGDSWAATEASSCCCADEGLSASPEIIDGVPLHEARKGGSGEPASMFEREDSPEETLPLLQPKGRKGASQSEPAAAKTGREGMSSADFGENRARETTEMGGGAEEETCDALRDVHGVLRELTLAVLSCCPILTSSDDASIQAVNCVDQQILGVTYGPVYARVASGQTRERDTALAQRVRREEYSRREAGRPSLAATCDTEALAALRSAGAARTGRDKLEFLVQAVERVSESLPAKATTDMLLRSLCRHLAAATMGSGGTATRSAEMWGRNNGRGGAGGAPLARPHAEVAFVEQFMRDESWLMGKQGYVLTTVDAALHVLLDPAMSDEIFSDSSITVEGDNDPEGSSVEQTCVEDGS